LKKFGRYQFVDESVVNYRLLANLLEHIALNSEEFIVRYLPGFMEVTKAMVNNGRKEFFQSPDVVIHLALVSQRLESRRLSLWVTFLQCARLWWRQASAETSVLSKVECRV
jgi:hypothetical protein